MPHGVLLRKSASQDHDNISPVNRLCFMLGLLISLWCSSHPTRRNRGCGVYAVGARTGTCSDRSMLHSYPYSSLKSTCVSDLSNTKLKALEISALQVPMLPNVSCAQFVHTLSVVTPPQFPREATPVAILVAVGGTTFDLRFDTGRENCLS